MADEVQQQETQQQDATPQGGAQATPQGDGIDWKAEARKWEQRAKNDLARISELEQKAKAYDELQEAQKSDLEKANDAATKAQAEAADWKSKFEAAQAEQERQRTVSEMATRYGVDMGTLARMSGEVEDNAKYLAGLEAQRPKFGASRDGGEQPTPTMTLEEALEGVKGIEDRIRIRAEFNARNRK